MSLIKGIDHVQVAMPKGEEEKARHFYGVLLGLPEIEKPPVLKARGGAWFQAGNQQIHLGVEEDFLPAKKAHPGFLVEESDINLLATHLQDSGIEVTFDINNEKVKRFFVKDPFGNRIEFTTN